MIKNIFALTLLSINLLSNGHSYAATSGITISKIDIAHLAPQNIKPEADLVSAVSVQDKNGAHILVLTRKIGPSHIKKNPSRNERIDLLAVYYTGANGNWIEEWEIKDFIDCPGLDSSASFFAEHVTITDLDKNGVAEVSVPYKMFCGGGIDPSTLKIIMRQGKDKFGLRGETLVETPGNEPFGGEVTYDKSLLLPENAHIKNHLDSIRKQVYLEKH